MRVLFYYRGSEHIGLESIMAYVQSKGHLVELIYEPALGDNGYIDIPALNNFFYNDELVINKALRFKPDLICFSAITNLYMPIKKLARKSALAYKSKNNEILILEDFKLSNPRTSDYLKIIKAFGLESKKTLLVINELSNNIYLSSRNIKNSKVIINSELNTYEITDANNILILESAVEGIESTLK